MGGDSSDSQLDVLLYSGGPHPPECLLEVVCGKENPLITSHHDLIVSSFSSSQVPYSPPPQAVVAPRDPNTRVKVLWDDDDQEQYKILLSSTLPLLQEHLYNPASPSLSSILLDCSSYALTRAAEDCFKTVQLSQPP